MPSLTAAHSPALMGRRSCRQADSFQRPLGLLDGAAGTIRIVDRFHGSVSDEARFTLRFALLCQPDSSHIRPMPKNPDNPKKPIKTPQAKAHGPDVKRTGPARAELLTPAINRGDAGLGSGTGLQPPPDNSWDRRAGGEAAAHRARASTKETSGEVAKRDGLHSAAQQ